MHAQVTFYTTNTTLTQRRASQCEVLQLAMAARINTDKIINPIWPWTCRHMAKCIVYLLEVSVWPFSVEYLNTASLYVHLPNRNRKG